MRIASYITQSWKMLESSQHLTALLQALQIGLGHLRHNPSIVPIGAQVQLRVVNVGYIDYRSQIKINPVGGEIICILYSSRERFASIVARANGSSSRTWPIQACQSTYSSPFLISRERQGHWAILLHLL